jgi:hypothetical protein
MKVPELATIITAAVLVSALVLAARRLRPVAGAAIMAGRVIITAIAGERAGATARPSPPFPALAADLKKRRQERRKDYSRSAASVCRQSGF